MTIVPDVHPSYQIQTGNTYLKHLFAEALLVFFCMSDRVFPIKQPSGETEHSSAKKQKHENRLTPRKNHQRTRKFINEKNQRNN